MPGVSTTWTSALLDLLFEDASVGRCLVAPDGSVLRANSEWLRSTGFSLDDVLGERIIDLFPAARDMTLAVHARARAGHRVDVPRHAQLIGGRETWWEGRVEPIPMEGGTGLLITARDVMAEVAREAAAAERSRLAAIVDGTDDAIILKDLHGVILAWNAGAQRLFGYTAGEAIGRPIRMLIPPERQAEEDDILRQIVAGRQVDHFVTQRLTKHGESVQVSITASPVRDLSGKIIGASKIARDVASQNRIEEALRDSTSRLRRFYESGLLGVFHWNMDGIITDANDKFLDLIGYRRDELGHIDWVSMTPPEYRHLDERSVVELRATGMNKVPFEKEYVRKDGTRMPVIIAGAMVDKRLHEGIAFVLDITERKRMEEQLRASEERFRFAAIASRAMVYDEDMQTMRIREFAGLHGLLGYESSEAQLTLEWWDRQIVPEDLPRVRAVRERRNQSKPRGDMVEYRVRHKDGRIVRVEDNALLLWNSNGELARVVGAVVDITERKRVEQTLRASEEQLRLALSAGAMATWDWNVSSDEITWNDEHFRMLGYEVGALTPSYQAWADRIHPEDRVATEKLVRTSVQKGGDYRSEFRALRPDGTIRWIEARGRVEHGSAQEPVRQYGVMLDVTERKTTEEALAAANQRLSRDLDALMRLHELSIQSVREGDISAVLDEMVETAIAITRADMGNIQLLDPASRTLRVVAHRGHEQSWLDFFASVPEGQGATCGTAMNRGERIIVEDVTQSPVFVGTPALEVQLRAGVRAVQSTPLIDSSGQLLGMLSTHYRSPTRPGERDLHLLDLLARQASDMIELAHALELVRSANTALKDADRRKDEFLAVLSHELRNPLAPIRNSIHLLDRAPEGSDTARRARDVLQRQTDHLTRLVDDLLDLTRISHGRIELQLARIDARDVVRRACDDIRTVFEQRSVELRYSQPAEPAWVDADEARLAQMVGNLVSNALKFTQPGGQVGVAIRTRGQTCEISVRDTGMGIEPADLERIFDPFVQAGQARPGARSGLGIGLSLVKDLVVKHGGSVRAESAGLGQGADFVLALPLAAAPTDTASKVEAGQGTSSLSVLVVEDNVDAGLSMADVLGLSGHQAKVVGTGRAGIEAVSAQVPDVLICDVGLPDLSGYEVIRTLRTTGSKVFAIALTGFAQPQDRDRALEAGFDAHLAKPPDLVALKELLAEAARKKR